VWVTPEIKQLVEKISDAQGITVSEYIRSLVTADLDKRTFFTTQVKEEIAKSNGGK
jgi:hypothetical protein